MAFVQTLKLSNFRCYESLRLEDISAGLVVLTGANGAGKTNILEAVSMLTPGRGLRGAKLPDMQRRQGATPWAVAGDIAEPNALGDVTKIGCGLEPVTEKRVVRINGVTVKSQNALADYLACIWLTPQMDRLFIDSSRERRRFLDRLVFAFDPLHSARVSRYENALAQRSKLLRSDRDRGGYDRGSGRTDPHWLDALEGQIAEAGVALAAARLDFVERLQRVCIAEDHTHFPLAQLRAHGTIEELLGSAPALEVEDMFRYQLASSRGVDMLTGGAATGPHKSDLLVKMAEKNMQAAQCSTGEQKALLIGIVLAHARLVAAERGAAPILLLDEVAAHLDENRRAALYDLLRDIGGQVWLTGTDEALFSDLHVSPAQCVPAQFFTVEKSSVFSLPPKTSGASGASGTKRPQLTEI
ncbi:MAG: DNA replication/repair protein RecF [Alphaproteobacteria bacterium]